MTHLSIIVPAFNEENYLPSLLESLENQNYNNYDTIVVDNNSSDDTSAVAKNYNTQIVKEVKQGPGYARNKGAEIADGDIFLFLDADVILPHEDVLGEVVELLSETNIVSGTGTWQAYDGNRFQKALTALSSNVIEVCHATKAIKAASGAFLFIQSNTFDEINGFNGELPYNEDHDLMKRASQHGETKLIKDICQISTRRLQKRGLSRTTVDYLLPSLLYLTGRHETLKSLTFKSGNPS